MRYNAYGPTEFTVDATYFEMEKRKDYASIPIGRPAHRRILEAVGTFLREVNRQLVKG